MNDFDRAARYAVKTGPEEARQWLFPRIPPVLRYRGWLDAQSAPRPGEADRRCDTIMELDDQQGPPWACVIELFTEADADAIDRAMEYQGRFRRELRHGPHGHDRYQFVVALVFLTGAPRETRLDMNLPGMPEVGTWFGPRVLDIAEEDAVAHVEAIEENRLARWLLIWLPLMCGGQTVEMARRWRTLAEPDERAPIMAALACTFARLVGCEDVYRQEVEGIMMKTAPLFDEVRMEREIEVRRQDTLEVLETRFPGIVPAAVVKRVKEEADYEKLRRWHKLAITASLEEFHQQMD